MSETATLVVTAVPNTGEMDLVQKYLGGVMPLMVGAGGRLVKRLKVGETLLGNPSGMVLVMDFDSAESIHALFESDEYKELVAIREKAFGEMNIMVAHEL